MHRVLVATAMCFCCTPVLAGGQLIPSLKFENITADDVEASFTPQKATWSIINTISIWGQIANESPTITLRSVSVTFTALDKDRNFLGRHKWYTDPKDINPKAFADIDDKHIDTEERKPAIIQYEVRTN